MRFLSVCSGIESASVAWRDLGWSAVGYAEIEPFPARVLHHHFGCGRPRVMPDPNEPGITGKQKRSRAAAIKAVSKIKAEADGAPNFGDFTSIDTDGLGRVDLLVGGTPCQSFSTAGKRLSLADARGNLSLAFTVLAHELVRSHGLRWAVWENVPGVLSTSDNAFGCFLAGLVGADDPLCLPTGTERWPDEGMVEGPRARAAWRILDAQYFGLAQRRRRVFVVVGFGDGADPAEVLFEPIGLRRHPPSRGQTGEGSTIGSLTSTSPGGGWRAGADEAAAWHVLVAPVAPTLNAAFGTKLGLENQHVNNGCGLFVAHTLRAEGFDASEDGTGRGTPLVPVCFDPRQTDVLVHGDRTGHFDTKFPGPAIAFDTTQITSKENRCNPQPGDPCHPLAAAAHAPAIAFTCKDHGQDAATDLAPTLRAMQGEHANAGGQVALATPWAVRRLTPTECARLQGFPDDWCAIPGAADGNIYRALGNAMATHVMSWIGRRIREADKRA